ncbi:MAG: DUF499 domain-containing protein [Armatimonadetes bacterium]|nr:DUF499 domain-containing protein [Armatimonadota bacterium]
MTLPIWWHVARPHEDVLSGELTEEKFAANLWAVAKGSAPDDYQDAERFFHRTHITGSMEQLLGEILKRLREGKGNSTITLQTPFGGGKTHALILLWHFFKNFDSIKHLDKVKKLVNKLGKPEKVRIAVFVGDAVDPLPDRPPFTPMGHLMEQLGVYDEIKKHDEQQISPGAERLAEILKAQPTLLLLDELAIYSAKLYGRHKDWQTVHSFWQELTVAASQVQNCVIVATLPTSAPYGYETGEAALHQLQQIFGRVERPFAPVKGLEVYEVIRQRLFQDLGDEETRRNVATSYSEFYERRSKLFPSAVREVSYRDRIFRAYPFHPLLIDLLRERWGTIEGFQRTRGVLRLLAQVVRDLYGKSNLPLIHAGDVDLSGEVRQMLLRVIDERYNGVLSADITDGTAHSAEVDKSLGKEFEPMRLGTKMATAIFLASHHGGRSEEEDEGIIGLKRGIEREWLRVAVWNPTTENAPIDEALRQLEERCWYLDEEGGLLFFGLEPSLEKIVQDEMGRISDEKVFQALKNLLETATKADTFKTYIFPENSRDIVDDESLKLVVISPDFTVESEQTKQKVSEWWEYRGETPRTYRNTIFFVVAEQKALDELYFGYDGLKRKLAMEAIKKEHWKRLNERRQQELNERLQSIERQLPTRLLNAYRHIVYPISEGLKWEDLGTATAGEASLSQRVRNFLQTDRIGKLITKLTPERLVRYTFGKDERCKSVKDLRAAFCIYPDLPAVSNANVVNQAVREGVQNGVFALKRGDQILMLTSVPEIEDDDEVLRWLEVDELTTQHIKQLAYGKKKVKVQELQGNLGKLLKDEQALKKALKEGEEQGLWKMRRDVVEFEEVPPIPVRVTVDDLLDALSGKDEASVREVYDEVRAKFGELDETEFVAQFVGSLRQLGQTGWQLEVEGQTVSLEGLREGLEWQRILTDGMLRRVFLPPLLPPSKGIRYQFVVGWDKLGQLGQMIVQLVKADPELRDKLQVLVIMSAEAEIPENLRKWFEEGLDQLGAKEMTIYSDGRNLQQLAKG